MEKIYKKLTELVKDNIVGNENELISFELASGLKYSIFDYPVETLLSIEKNEDFIYECYFKLLDRSVDLSNFTNLLNALNNDRITREDILKNIYDSRERANINTQLNYGNK